MFMSNSEVSRRRVFGVGVLATGFILLAVALIMGLKFPVYVVDTNVRDMCILDSKHDKYQIWVEDGYRERYNKIYYWQVINVEDFLYKGVFPKFQQVGPYIYTEKQEKVDVSFKYTTSHVVEFYEWKKQEYAASLTRAECGEHCTEADQITVLNNHYFQQMAVYGSDLNLSWHHLPEILQHCFQNLALATENTLSVYSLLGALDPGDIDILSSTACKNFLTFGQWLRQNDTSTKAATLEMKGNQDLQAVEMCGLYGVLLSEILLGSAKETFLDATIADFCDRNVDSFELPQFKLGYDIHYDPVLGLFIEEDVVIQCGLIHWLEKYRQLMGANNSPESHADLLFIIQQYLCLNTTMFCVNITHDEQPWQSMYLSAIMDYIYNHLLPFAFHKSVMSTNTDIIITRKQRDLALGYFYARNTSNPFWAEAEEEEDISEEVTGEEESSDLAEFLESTSDPVFVEGILEDVCCEEDVPGRSKHISLLTCYDAINAQSNFRWHAYEHKKHATEDQFPNASESSRRVNGWRENYPPLLSLKTCSSPNLSHDNASFFLPQFWRNIFFTKSHQCGCKINGVRVNTLLFDESNLQTKSGFVSEQGLQEMTGSHGYLSWVSLPHYLYTNESFTAQYDMSPTTQLHLPNVSIEPITGNVWGKSIKFQHSVGILPSYIQMDRFQGLLMINATGVPLPVYWVEHSFQYNQAGTDDHYERVSKLMSASCGGLISLGIISCIIITFGLLIVSLKLRGNRVAPEPEQETSNFYGSVRFK